MIKNWSWLACGLLTLGCATTPPERQVRFEVDWVRSTLASENFGARHSERTAPTLDDGVIYQGNGVDGVAAYNRQGTVQWRFAVKNGVESGITVDEDSLFFGASDGQIYSLNKKTGRLLWNFPTRVENLSQPTLNGGVAYILAGNNVVYALDAKTGKQLWLYNRGDASSLSIRGGTKPAVYANTLYVGFTDGFLVALNIKDGSMIWERKLATNIKFIDIDASPVVDKDYIWVSSFDGALFCLSRPDGQVVWRIDDGGSVAVAIEGDKLYYASLSDTIYEVNKKTGTVGWKFNFREKDGVPTQPVIYRGLVLVGASDGALMALSQISGKLLASYRPGVGVFATPALDAKTGEVWIHSNQANLHKLKIFWWRPQDNLEWKGSIP